MTKPPRPQMISIPEAENRIRQAALLQPVLELPLRDALGSALARDLDATSDVPPFHRVMMDGYAVRAEDTASAPVILELVDEVPAGSESRRPVAAGQAMRIMTGAPLPAGANAVQIREVCQEHPPGRVSIGESIRPGRNIAFRGSEFTLGTTVLTRGQVLAPPDLAVLAIFGYDRVPVYRKPSLCLINTGSELVEAGDPIEGGKIRNSNRYSILSFLEQNGYPGRPAGTVPDDPAAIRRAISTAMDTVVLLTGGVSVGDFDLVQAAAEAEGYRTLVEAVAMKPGKPLLVAERPGQLLFGLSGNPVSSLLQAVRFLLPALRRMAGWSEPDHVLLDVELAGPVRHRPGRTSYRPGMLAVRNGRIYCQPVPDKGSADLFSWHGIDGHFLIPAGDESVPAGGIVQFMLLPGARTFQHPFPAPIPDAPAG